MAERQPFGRGLVIAYVELLEARDWAGFARLLADDIVYELPQTGERIRGRERFVQFNQEYPGDWHLRVRDAYGDAFGGAVHLACRVGDDDLDAVGFLRFDEDGLIVKVTEYWPEAYEPPAGREHLTDRA